ncbi:DUF4252 domain-containing protein [Chitinophaga sp. XS-30]|uniref:DUF4252 domain-containing protein n=1 Tax=Chitinophaga sp. XS-30 TaxID=2604421 RepID=UPI0011DC7CAC|nr:DUF4252 domain-containing protein [Chitinophaga sp. XS-30]QEH42329.1 DUF4252 domain-containing protein [Chitinophaga sp. XS-30]
MKRILFIIVVGLCCSQYASAQVIDKFFRKYQDDPSFTVINITPKMFSMFSKLSVDDPDVQKLSNVVGKLKGLRILVKENTKDGKKLYTEAAQFLTADLEELMTLRNEGADVKFMIKENAKGNIAELIMLVGSPSEFVALSLFGDISLNEIAEIAGDIKIDGFENLSKLPKKKK